MTALAILVLTVLISVVVVKIGTTALRMTGMEEHAASFQSLSAFTGTGFTTREAEQVVRSPTRRRVVRVLMILGNAGLATVIASAIATFGGSTSASGLLLRVAALAAVGALIYRLAMARRVNTWLSEWIERRLQQHTDLDHIDFEEILRLDRHRGVASVEVHTGNPVVGQALRDLGLTHNKVLVLAVERQRKLLEGVGAETKLESGDRLFCYGDPDVMKQLADGDYRPSAAPHAPYHELLALDEAYRVLSFNVAGPALAGHTLRELRLTQKRVVVLAIRRGDTLEPSPGADSALAEGDQLICYGPIEALRRYAEGDVASIVPGTIAAS